ncbi:MAG: hypothetical protein H6721_32450 [Sandaracinus sp.]|nr:hypothetical protein [Sandaracinus sp.]MCB9625072.1 hypothetical protein [Sandaracinus sp.]MCB9636847.1 hypothetical protein [Sandaracinus sp.]
MSTSPCPVCRTPEPGLAARVFGAARARCVSCGVWLVPSQDGWREEDPLLLPCLQAADAAVQALDTGATYSVRRRFFLERGLRGSALDDALAMLEDAMPVPRGEPPEAWVRFVETRRPGGYREAAKSTRKLLVRRPGGWADIGGSLAVSAYFGVLLYELAPWGPIVGALVPMTFLVGRLKTARWSLEPDRWHIPGRWLGRTTSVDPKTIESIAVTRARLKNDTEVFGLSLRAASVEHVLAHPSTKLTEESAHGLARLLEEHAGLLPRRVATKVRVEVAEEHDAQQIEERIEHAPRERER